jgi:hypothetical protein
VSRCCRREEDEVRRGVSSWSSAVLTTLGSPEVLSGVGLVRARTGFVTRREVRLRCESASVPNATKRRSAESAHAKIRADLVLI